MTKRIPDEHLNLAEEALRFHLLHRLNELVLRVLSADPNLTIAKLAASIGWKEKMYREVLAGERELALDHISDIAFSCGKLVEFYLVERKIPDKFQPEADCCDQVPCSE